MLCAPARASMLTGYHDCRPNKWVITQGWIYEKITTGELTPSQIEAKLNSALVKEPLDEVFLPYIFKKQVISLLK